MYGVINAFYSSGSWGENRKGFGFCWQRLHRCVSPEAIFTTVSHTHLARSNGFYTHTFTLDPTRALLQPFDEVAFLETWHSGALDCKSGERDSQWPVKSIQSRKWICEPNCLPVHDLCVFVCVVLSSENPDNFHAEFMCILTIVYHQCICTHTQKKLRTEFLKLAFLIIYLTWKMQSTLGHEQKATIQN